MLLCSACVATDPKPGSTHHTVLHAEPYAAARDSAQAKPAKPLTFRQQKKLAKLEVKRTKALPRTAPAKIKVTGKGNAAAWGDQAQATAAWDESVTKDQSKDKSKTKTNSKTKAASGGGSLGPWWLWLVAVVAVLLIVNKAFRGRWLL
ncbi:hypothetical protein GCM10023186_41950 [Hymenobacter koreensis]|uniref:Uncharacterized protein n=1 Tax=Hymenobacter koreensis TaxID=1084523 RepID=A0ABP8JKG1_9BACT